MIKHNYHKDLKSLCNNLGIKILSLKEPEEIGLCVVNGVKYIILDKEFNELTKAEHLAIAISSIGIDNLYIPPYLREFIEISTRKN
ncbi:hypothetical protein MASR1M45_05250 [Candidatus Kapaibacterium sp.]